MFKVVKLHNIAPEIMKELFAPKMSPYDLRNNNSFKSRRVKHTGNILKKNLQLTGVC